MSPTDPIADFTDPALADRRATITRIIAESAGLTDDDLRTIERSEEAHPLINGMCSARLVATRMEMTSRLMRRLARRKADDRILFVVVGDHGNSAYQTPVEIEELVHRGVSHGKVNEVLCVHN